VSFNINPDLALNYLIGDANDVTLPEQRKQTLRNTKKCKILNILYILYYVTYILYYVLYISYYVFDGYSLVFVLNRMSKRLKSVTKKLFGGKSSSRALSMDTLFQGCSTAGRRRAEMMRRMDPSLVGSSTCSQRDEVTFLFSYHFSNMKLLTSLPLIFQEENSLRREEKVTPLTAEDWTPRRRRRSWSYSWRRSTRRRRGTTKGRPGTMRTRWWG
jgi:hypothetical protein